MVKFIAYRTSNFFFSDIFQLGFEGGTTIPLIILPLPNLWYGKTGCILPGLHTGKLIALVHSSKMRNLLVQFCY